MRSLFLLVFTLGCTVLLSGQTTDSRLKGIDTVLQKVLETWKAPGFAVAVVEKNKIVYAAGFGYSNLEDKQKVTPNTLFQIGSCTKAFTAGILGILEEEGKVDLDDSPRKYVPYLKFYNEEMDNFVVIKDLIRHSTGLPRHDYAWYLFPGADKDSLLMRVAHHEPFEHVRASWYYNNFMYLAQGVIAEKVTSKTWEEQIKTRFFQPLNMNRSNVSVGELKRADDKATGYQTMPDGKIERMDYYPIMGMAPAGSLNSSVNDMTNWLIMWINGGKYQDKVILPASYVIEAMSSQMVVNGGLPTQEHPDIHFANYGYGWFLTSYKGHYRVEHGGNIDGFSASTCFFPMDSIGIVVLTNQNGSRIPSIFRNIIADKMLKVEEYDWNNQLKAELDTALAQEQRAVQDVTTQKKLGTQPSHILQDFVGSYAHPGYGTFELEVHKDSLIAQFPTKRFWLRHFHYNIFEFLELTLSGVDSIITEGTKLNFTTNLLGDISSAEFELEPTVKPIVFKRTPKSITLTPESLSAYVGTYLISNVETKFYIKNTNVLYASVQGQPEYELIAIDKHQFLFKILEGYKIKFEEANGKIVAVEFIQPNGTFKAIRKAK